MVFDPNHPFFTRRRNTNFNPEGLGGLRIDGSFLNPEFLLSNETDTQEPLFPGVPSGVPSGPAPGAHPPAAIDEGPAHPPPGPSRGGGAFATTQNEFANIDPVNVPVREFPKPENPFLKRLEEALLNADFDQLNPEQNALLNQAQDVTAGRGAVRGLGAPTQASLISATAPLLANFRQQNINNLLGSTAAQSSQDLGFRSQDIGSFLGQLNNLTTQRAQDINQSLGLKGLDLRSQLGFAELDLQKLLGIGGLNIDLIRALGLGG